jgi:hypothetical protein
VSRLGYHPVVLTPFADEIWTETRRARFLGVETGSRMTVVRTAGGGLFVHSPVALDDDLRREVDALGEVAAVVSPSLFHHLHVAGWMAAYPRATFAACPGLEWKRPDLAFTCVMADEPHPAWRGELEQVYFSARRENEVVFLHARTRTLVCADAMLNLSAHDLASTRFVAGLMRNTAPGKGWMEPLMVRDRKVARRQVDRILAWDFERAVLSHGALLDRDARALFEQAYAWV